MFLSRENRVINFLSLKKNSISSYNLSFFNYSREAIYLIFKEIELNSSDEVLVPNFLCNSAITPILEYTQNIKFYPLDEKLNIIEDELNLMISKKSRVIFIVDYFGVESKVSKSLQNKLKEKNIIILKDSAHSFLTLFDKKFISNYEYDYLVSSIYKNLSLNIGAIALGKLESKPQKISTLLFFKRLMISTIKKILSIFGCEKLINQGIENLIINDEKYIQPKIKLNFYYFYSFLLSHLNINKIIKEKKELSLKYFDYLNNFNEVESIFSKEDLKSNLLQAYPIILKNRSERDELFFYLRSKCIDAYTWPTFHPICVNEKLWEKLLLVPLDKKVLELLKEYFSV